MRPIDRFGVRTVSLALCIALAASSGQPLWAAVAKQTQVRPPTLAPIPVLPATIDLKAAGALAQGLGAPSSMPAGVVSAETASQEAKTQAAVALAGVVQFFHGRPNHTQEALNGVYEGSKAGGSAVGAFAAPAVGQGAGPLAKAKRILKISAPLIAAAPLAVSLAASDHSGGLLSWLSLAALPLLGMISDDEKWERIRKLVDNENMDASVKRAIKQRERALALLQASRTNWGSSNIYVKNASLTAVLEAEHAAGRNVEEILEAMRGQATSWGDWIQVARVEHRLGLDPKPSLEKAKQRAGAVPPPGAYSEADGGSAAAFIAIGETERELGFDPAASFESARGVISDFLEINPMRNAEPAVELLTRLAQAEIGSKADAAKTTAEMRAAIDLYDGGLGVNYTRLWRVRSLARMAELEIEAGLDPDTTLRAAEAWLNQVPDAGTMFAAGDLARAQAKAALALLKKSASILWNAFRFGAPVLAVGLIAFLTPSSALAATAAAAAGWGSKSLALLALLALLAIGALGGVLSLKKWTEIDGLANNEGTDKSLREAIKQHAEARRLLEDVRRRVSITEYTDELLPYIAMLEFEGGIDPGDTLKAAEKVARASRSSRPRISTALIMGLAGQDPLPLLQDAKRVIRESKVPSAAYWGAYHAISIAQVEALLGRDYRESLDEAMRFIQRERSSGWDGGLGEVDDSQHAEWIIDVARAAIQTDLDPAPAFQAARQIDAGRGLAIEWPLDDSVQTVSQYIDAVAAGETQHFDFFDRMVLYLEDFTDLAQARTLLRQARPKLWPLHRVGPAPL